MGWRVECLGKAGKSEEGEIIHATLDQPHGGVMTVNAVGELCLSQTQGATTKANLLADQTVHRFAWCRHAGYHSIESGF